MRIIVTTCDRYLPAILPLAHLLKKYWHHHPPVLVGGFTPPDFDLPANFSFHSIGKQEDYPIGKWSNGLIKFFNEIDDEAFLFLLDDMPPIRQVNSQAIKMLYDYVIQFRNVARMDVTDDRLYSGGADKDYGNCGHLKLVKSSRDSEYFSSMMPGIWRRSHFLRLLIPNESPWDIELRGTPRLRRMRDVDVLGVHCLPYKCTLMFRGGDSGKLAMEIPYKPDPADIMEMSALGLLKPWEDE